MILALLTQVSRLHPAASEPLSPLTFMEVMAGICHWYHMLSPFHSGVPASHGNPKEWEAG